jgi:hypothetical protein
MSIKEVSPGRYELLIPITTSEAEGMERTLIFTATDETIDRSEDIMRFDGWKFNNYLKNSVVLWAHNRKEPSVAKTIKIEADNRARAWKFYVKFPTIEELSSDTSHPSEHALFCDCLYNLYKNKYLNAVSVGFDGEGKYRKDSKNGHGIDFTSQELYELSLVPIPDNPNALQRAKEAGIHVEYYMKGVNMTVEKSGARLSKTSRERLEKLAGELRAFLDEDKPEEEEGCDKGTGIEEGTGETGGIEKPKSADVPTEKVLVLGVSALEIESLR